MKITRPAVDRDAGPAGRLGYSLIEIMVVLSLISILIAMGVPSYQRAVEQSRADAAGADLRAIWSAERLYWLDYQTYTSDLNGLKSLGVLDPAITAPTTGYVYSLPSATTSTFQAMATRTGSPAWNGSFSIDETGSVTGNVTALNQTSITPGFQ